MHRDMKLQHALLQQIAQKIGVSQEATAEMRQLVEDAPEGTPVAALLRTNSPSQSTNVALTDEAARIGKTSSSYSSTEKAETLSKAD